MSESINQSINQLVINQRYNDHLLALFLCCVSTLYVCVVYFASDKVFN